MDDSRIGRILRALRRHRSWRQTDVGRRAGISQDLVSLIERGHIERVSLRGLRRVARALDAELVVAVRWRAGDLDRLLDEGHATLLGRCAAWLESLGWVVQPEVTYSVYGERGSIDLLAWHAPTRTLLVIEVKTELTSVEETLRRHDAKVRLAASIAAERFGWRPQSVARLLVLPTDRTSRRRVARHDAVLARAYPLRGAAVRRWLREPTGAVMSGLVFVSLTNVVRAGRRSVAPKRIHRPGASVTRA